MPDPTRKAPTTLTVSDLLERFCVFFFQAEDGIRDKLVTGVQTSALPILIGDIGSCVSALLAGIGSSWAKPPAEWLSAIAERKNKNIAKMGETLAKNPSPMNF